MKTVGPVATDGSAKWKTYVAIGDSFTEGLWDPEVSTDPMRGWADRLAEYLHVEQYANLAIRGRLLESIVTDQLPAALELKPDLISIAGGGNDILRPGSDPDRLARMLEYATIAAREAGCDVLLATGIETRHAGVLSATRSNTALLNTHIWSIARRHGAYVLDMWGLRAIHDWRMWAHDRIHLNADGHHRVANAAMVGLGQPAPDSGWDTPLPPPQPPSRGEKLAADARWFREDVYPWATRRIRRISSGDERAPKRPFLAPVDEPHPRREPEHD